MVSVTSRTKKKVEGIPMNKFAAIASLLAALGAASSQAASPQSSAAASSSVAFVYVSNFVSGDTNVITAYAAAGDGRLTPVPGSPFHDNVISMAVNGKYLFGSNRAGVYVAAFLIQSNGALKWTTSTDVARYNPSGCVVPGDLIFDHTGTDLYFAGTAGSEWRLDPLSVFQGADLRRLSAIPRQHASELSLQHSALL
jgi:hypothetical protein